MFAHLFRRHHDSTQARALVDQGAALVDVRTPQEFAGGHVDGALNIPLQVLPQRLSEVGPKARPVVLYCRSGARSATAAQILRNAGYQQVVDVGPMPRW